MGRPNLDTGFKDMIKYLECIFSRDWILHLNTYDIGNVIIVPLFSV